MKYVIIAPHPDDELIGCFRLFKNKMVKKVIYLKNTPERMNEAKKFCKHMKVVMEVVKNVEKIKLNPKEHFLVPSIHDSHPLHQFTSTYIKTKHPLIGYYTTEMNTEYTKELPYKLKEEKKQLLNKFYPSQKSLWENNHKYYLFEGGVLVL